MPWAHYRNMTDQDLKSIFAYLKTLKPIDHYVDNTQPKTKCARCKLEHGGGQRNKAVGIRARRTRGSKRSPELSKFRAVSEYGGRPAFLRAASSSFIASSTSLRAASLARSVLGVLQLVDRLHQRPLHRQRRRGDDHAFLVGEDRVTLELVRRHHVQEFAGGSFRRTPRAPSGSRDPRMSSTVGFLANTSTRNTTRSDARLDRRRREIAFWIFSTDTGSWIDSPLRHLRDGSAWDGSRCA